MGHVAAQTVQADSVGEVGVYGFLAWYAFVLTADDCVEARLRIDFLTQSTLDYGCGFAGQGDFNALYAPLDTGEYTFDIVSKTSGEILYSRSWTVPGIEMTTTVSSATADAGESVVVSAAFRLLPGGPDAYTIRGTLSVDAGDVQTHDISIVLLSAKDLDFWTGTPSSTYETFTAAVPLSFGTSGSRAVDVEYADAIHALTDSETVTVTDPSADEIAALEDEIATLRGELSASAAGPTEGLAALATLLGLAGIVLGFVGIWSARRALRAVAPPRRAPPSPFAPSPPAWPPPLAPAPPAGAPSPADPVPPAPPPQDPDPPRDPPPPA